MNAWAKLPESKYTIIPNTIHPERYGMRLNGLTCSNGMGLKDSKLILTLARLAGYERYKGIDEVLEALPGLLEQEPNLIYMVRATVTIDLASRPRPNHWVSPTESDLQVWSVNPKRQITCVWPMRLYCPDVVKALASCIWKPWPVACPRRKPTGWQP